MSERLCRKYTKDIALAENDKKKYFCAGLISLAVSFATASVNEFLCAGTFFASLYCFYHIRAIRVAKDYCKEEMKK